MSTNPSESKTNATQNNATAAYPFYVDRERREHEYSSEVEDKPTKKFRSDRVIVSREFIDQKTRSVMKAVIDELQRSPFEPSDESDHGDDDDESDDSYGKACNFISPKRLDEMKKEKINTMRDYITDLGKFEPMRRDFDKTFEPSGKLRVLNVVISGRYLICNFSCGYVFKRRKLRVPVATVALTR